MSNEKTVESKRVEVLCLDCDHALIHHTQYGCNGAFPNGTGHVGAEEVFYGECHCHYKPEKGQ